MKTLKELKDWYAKKEYGKSPDHEKTSLDEIYNFLLESQATRVSEDEIAEARKHFSDKWPDQLTSGVMFFNGRRITRNEFESTSPAPSVPKGDVWEISMETRSKLREALIFYAEQELEPGRNLGRRFAREALALLDGKGGG